MAERLGLSHYVTPPGEGLERAIQLAARAAERFGDKTALVFEDQTYTFRQLDDASSSVAAALAIASVISGRQCPALLHHSPDVPSRIVRPLLL